MEVKKTKTQFKKEIEKAKNLKELDSVYKKYLGKKGTITLVLKSLKNLPLKEKKRRGKELNLIKKNLEKNLFEKKKELEKGFSEKEFKVEKIDITQPGKKFLLGGLHPLTLVLREIEEIFKKMGFSIIEGPEIEDEWHHFDALNIPQDHPARDAWDTFWIKGTKKGNKMLMRAHTSPVQIRFMKKNNPPFQIIAPGRTFRYEATDASHDIQFYQIEGLMVDRNISAANFKAIISEFFRQFFKKNIKIKLRPAFFPFTEPSFEVDMTCLTCNGRGCPTCSQSGWLEMMGAGMVHPNVFKSCGLVAKEWQGFAFGMGLDRLAMMKYKINDIRLFYSGDLRFLRQF